MRSLFFIFFLAYSCCAYSQLINQQSSLFQLEGFFNDSVVKSKQIKGIKIFIANKKDGEKIKETTEHFLFKFNLNGQVSMGLKTYKKDSTINYFTYNKKGQRTTKIDQFGPFKFRYHYLYQNSKLTSEIKTNILSSRNDTLHERFYQHKTNGKRTSYLLSNKGGRAFLKKEKWSEKNYSTERTTYLRNQSSIEEKVFYIDKRITQKEKVDSFGKEKVVRTKYLYKNNRIEDIHLFENGVIKYTFGMIYNSDSTPKNIVERDYLNKSIRIYTFEYEYHL